MQQAATIQLSLIVDLTAQTRRRDAAHRLATHLGADDLLVFTVDEEVSALLAAPGLPQTLPQARQWKQFLEKCQHDEPWVSRDLVSPYTSRQVPALGVAGSDGSVLVLLGGTPERDKVEELQMLLPLVAASFRSERAASTALGHARVARDAAEQSQTLAKALDQARRDLGRVLAEVREARERASFLAEVSGQLAQSLEVEVALQNVVGQTVPRIADCCIIHLLDEQDRIQQCMAAEIGRRGAPFDAKLPGDPLLPLDQAHPIVQAIQSNRPLRLSEVSEAFWASYMQAPALPEALEAVQPASMIIAPLVVHSRSLGAITLINHTARRQYTDEDETLAGDLASRTAAAIDNARLYDALREADHRKDEFLATLAHELRNPLSPISNAIELLGTGRDDPDRVAHLREILRRQVRQMTRLIDDLIDVARISRGKVKLRLERADLRSMIHSAVEATRPAVDAAEHELTLEIPDVPLMLDADPARIAQVLSNLLNNAIKYTPHGGLISLTCERERGEAIVRVRDNGVGIPPSQQDRIFEMFGQIGGVQHTAQVGLGIGLTLVRTLLEMHGGTIRVHSAGENQGSTFTVRLPLPSEEGSQSSEFVPAKPDTEGGGEEPLRVMVVEDHELVAELFSELLLEMGHAVEIAHSGEEALERVGEFAPDVVFSDISMKGMDGYALARRLREREELHQVVLVALTGYSQDENRQRAMRAGFNHHMIKPVEAEALQTLLKSVSRRATPGSE